MTIQWGDTGRMVFGALKTFTFSLATPRESSLGVITLPNAEGATDQVSFTVQQSDLPTISPSPVSLKYFAMLVVSGKAGATTSTINYRILKNGTSVVTSSGSHTAGQYWTHNHWRLYDISVGDVLDVRCWSNVSDANIDYAALIIYPASVFVSKTNTILANITLGNTILPSLTGPSGRTTSVGTNYGYVVTPIATNASITFTVATNITAMSQTSNGFIRLNWGEPTTSGTTTNTSSSATSTSYQRQNIPSSLSFREILR